MNELIKKYGLFFILIKVLIYLLPQLALSLYPDILTFYPTDGGSQTFGIGYLELGFRYFFNLVLTIILYADMKKLQIKSRVLLLATLFSSLVGIIFFLLLAFEKLNITNFKNEQQSTKAII